MLDRQAYPLEIARKVLKPETINDVKRRVHPVWATRFWIAGR